MGDLVKGLGLLARGQHWALRHRSDWRYGMAPALITLVGYAGALVALVVWSDDLASWATPFADGWTSPVRGAFRELVTAMLVCGGLLVAVISFTAVTLLVGQPFYESLAHRVDVSQGNAPEPPDRSALRELWTGVRDSVRVLLLVGAFGVVLFVLGFVPVVGQTVVPAVGFCVSGFFLTAELSAVSMQRRDIALRERLRLLRGRPMLVLGFGVPLVLTFLVPFAAVVLMPGAVAGATLLTRELLHAAPPGRSGPTVE
ncbi:EI24 domain-containing protein [Actinacidiphila paucisporea]|uniref:CysZ protein n=1 Tax=Actinacidiphila paucisporea TaxID=310782 RepID=A0A1M7FRJ7_9ACTN|nr:EI24 domain-containing protein [Actinacidiphila paucisporea]SHM06606.1 CysZ protein [Actinacidiphila paucisporea]